MPWIGRDIPVVQNLRGQPGGRVTHRTVDGADLPAAEFSPPAGGVVKPAVQEGVLGQLLGADRDRGARTAALVDGHKNLFHGIGQLIDVLGGIILAPTVDRGMIEIVDLLGFRILAVGNLRPIGRAGTRRGGRTIRPLGAVGGILVKNVALVIQGALGAEGYGVSDHMLMLGRVFFGGGHLIVQPGRQIMLIIIHGDVGQRFGLAMDIGKGRPVELGVAVGIRITDTGRR